MDKEIINNKCKSCLQESLVDESYYSVCTNCGIVHTEYSSGETTTDIHTPWSFSNSNSLNTFIAPTSRIGILHRRFGSGYSERTSYHNKKYIESLGNILDMPSNVIDQVFGLYTKVYNTHDLVTNQKKIYRGDILKGIICACFYKINSSQGHTSLDVFTKKLMNLLQIKRKQLKNGLVIINEIM